MGMVNLSSSSYGEPSMLSILPIIVNLNYIEYILDPQAR